MRKGVDAGEGDCEFAAAAVGDVEGDVVVAGPAAVADDVAGEGDNPGG